MKEDHDGDRFDLEDFVRYLLEEAIEQVEFSQKHPRIAGFRIIVAKKDEGFPVEKPPSSENEDVVELLTEQHAAGDHIYVFAEIPGGEDEDVDVIPEKGGIIIRAVSGGIRFKKEVRLPRFDPGGIRVRCRNGVLEVILKRVYEEIP